MSGIFFCGTPQVRLCWAQTGHYMSDGHKTPLWYSQETGYFTTHCDATNAAPAVKKSVSKLKLPKAEPAKRAANFAAPGFVGVRPVVFRSGFQKRGEVTILPLRLPPLCAVWR